MRRDAAWRCLGVSWEDYGIETMEGAISRRIDGGGGRVDGVSRSEGGSWNGGGDVVTSSVTWSSDGKVSYRC